jgi:hypothetical protein
MGRYSGHSAHDAHAVGRGAGGAEATRVVRGAPAAFSPTLGGSTDINLVPQAGRINIGPFRPLEKQAVAAPGSLYFTYWVYVGSPAATDGRLGQPPTGVDQGLLIPQQSSQIITHGN